MREGAEIRMKEFNLDRIEIARAAALTVSDPKTHSMLRGIKNQCGVEVMKTLTPESSAVVLFGITIRDHAIKSESLGNFLTAVSIRNEDIAKIYAKEASAA